jgi:hypothetical protein
MASSSLERHRRYLNWSMMATAIFALFLFVMGMAITARDEWNTLDVTVYVVGGMFILGPVFCVVHAQRLIKKHEAHHVLLDMHDISSTLAVDFRSPDTLVLLFDNHKGEEPLGQEFESISEDPPQMVLFGETLCRLVENNDFTIWKADDASKLPGLDESFHWTGQYGVPVAHFPSQLRAKVDAFLEVARKEQWTPRFIFFQGHIGVKPSVVVSAY